MDKKTGADALKQCPEETPHHCIKCPNNKICSAQFITDMMQYAQKFIRCLEKNEEK